MAVNDNPAQSFRIGAKDFYARVGYGDLTGPAEQHRPVSVVPRVSTTTVGCET